MHIADNRILSLLQYILINNSYSLDVIMSKLNYSKRQIVYDINKINEILLNEKINTIKISKKKIIISDETKEFLLELDKSNKNYIIVGENKIWMIIIMIFCSTEPLGLNHFITDFKSSRSTILNDIKKINQISCQYKVNLIYTRKFGYHFVGTPKNIRTLALFAISNMKDTFLCKELIAISVKDKNYPLEYLRTEKTITDFITKYNLQVIKEYLSQSIYFISILPYHFNSSGYNPVNFDESYWRKLPLYTIVEKLFFELNLNIPNSEIEYIFILILGMTLGDEEYFKINTKESIFLKNLSKELANRFEAVTGSTFSSKKNIEENIFNHIQPAFFRLKYGITVVNPIVEQIKRDYGDIFSICRFVLEPFSDYLDCLIPDDEIAYIAIHFLAMIESLDLNKMMKRAIIVCQNGLSSSVMLRNQLLKMFPEIIFEGTYNLEEFYKADSKSYDIVFSTVENLKVDANKFLFTTPPIISSAEKFFFSELIYSTVFGIKKEIVNVNSIIEIVKDFADIKDMEGLKTELQKLLNNKLKISRKDRLPVLKDLLTKNTIQFIESVSDWKEAIYIGAKPLIDNGSINESYVEAIIENVETHGPYIVISPLIAIPHAQNKEGVNKVAMSYLKLESEVLILDKKDKPVKILITLAAVDNNTHLKALAQLSNLLSDTENREKLIHTNDMEEVLNMIANTEN